MRKFIFVAAPLAALLLSNAVHAASSAELKVIGRIIPASCGISLTQPTVSYGTLGLDQVSATDNTVITPSMSGTNPTTTMNITCDAPAQVAINILDNKSTTAEGSVAGDLTATAGEIFGLGSDNSNGNIGAFSITGGTVTVDGAVGKVIESTNGGTNWTEVSTAKFKNAANWMMSWTSASGGASAEPIESVAQELILKAAVVPSDDLDTTADVELAGSVTMELEYL